MIRVLGIDPSLTGTAYVYVRNGKLVEQKLVKTKPTGDDRVAELRRLLHIRNEIDTTSVDLAVMEGMAFMAKNTISLIQLSGLNYLIREKLYSDGIPFVIVAPTTLKKFITGSGNSQKDVMMMEVYKQYGQTMTDDNLCDAFSLAMLGHAMLSKKVKLNKSQNEVVELLKPQLKQQHDKEKENNEAHKEDHP